MNSPCCANQIQEDLFQVIGLAPEGLHFQAALFQQLLDGRFDWAHAV